MKKRATGISFALNPFITSSRNEGIMLKTPVLDELGRYLRDRGIDVPPEQFAACLFALMKDKEALRHPAKLKRWLEALAGEVLVSCVDRKWHPLRNGSPQADHCSKEWRPVRLGPSG